MLLQFGKNFRKAWNMVIVAGIVANVVAETLVTADISANTRWTRENSPYVVSGVISVNNPINACTLSIDPGVTVKFSTNSYLFI